MKRADQNTEWSELAKFPRRSYLGKYRRLKPSQERWIRSLLSLWGCLWWQWYRTPFRRWWDVVNDHHRVER